MYNTEKTLRSDTQPTACWSQVFMLEVVIPSGFHLYFISQWWPNKLSWMYKELSSYFYLTIYVYVSLMLPDCVINNICMLLQAFCFGRYVFKLWTGLSWNYRSVSLFWHHLPRNWKCLSFLELNWLMKKDRTNMLHIASVSLISGFL